MPDFVDTLMVRHGYEFHMQLLFVLPAYFSRYEVAKFWFLLYYSNFFYFFGVAGGGIIS